MAQQINRHTLDEPQALLDYLRAQEREIATLKRQIADLSSTGTTNQPLAISTVTLRSISSQLQSNGLAPLNVTGLIGRLNEAQDARIPRLTAHPDPLSVTYDLYLLSGSPDTLWGINRTVNTPTRFQIIVVTNDFADNLFRVSDDADPTKKVAFDVGALVATGTVRTMTVPNANQILAGRNVDNAFSVLQNFAAGLTSTTGAFSTSLQTGGGTVLTLIKIYTPALTPAAVAANTTAEQTFTVTGLTTADTLGFIIKPTAQAGLGIVGCRVSAADTLAITFCNVTAAPITPTAGEVYRLIAFRS